VGYSNLTFVVQEPQLGTGDALRRTEGALRSATGTLVLLSGDVPLLRGETLKTLVDHHRATHARATVLTAIVDEPRGYGRIVRSGEQIARIVEEKDATPTEREVREINSGIYAFALEGLFDAVKQLGADNAQQEYYLPDLVHIFRQRGLRVETVAAPDSREIQGINSRSELARLGRIVRDAKTAELMAAGVTVDDPSTTYVDSDVTVGADTILHP
jgi:bifunctional UDP-N-acetylglucosamine pyrophosphorylase/glucosamine-1-phosphate N-acetyltransferase